MRKSTIFKYIPFEPAHLSCGAYILSFSQPADAFPLSQVYVLQTYTSYIQYEGLSSRTEIFESFLPAPIVTPYMQLTLLGSALLGLLLVILVFANDTSPWKDLLSRGALHLLQNFGVAFLFFFSSDIAAQLLPWIRSHALPMTWLLLLPRVWLNLGREFVEQVNVKWSRACRSGTHTAPHSNVLQHTKTHCNALQHTTTPSHCNIL